MDTTELVKKLLAEGAKEFPHQWSEAGNHVCGQCGTHIYNPTDYGCPALLQLALDTVIGERNRLIAALDRPRTGDINQIMSGRSHR